MNRDQNTSQPVGRWTIDIEKKTVSAMVRVYCRKHHGCRQPPCPACGGLLTYSHKRLDNCVFGEEKPSCRECPVHCYRSAERAAMRQVMRFAGPQMLLRHPLLTLIHLWREHSPFRRRPEDLQNGGGRIAARR